MIETSVNKLVTLSVKELLKKYVRGTVTVKTVNGTMYIDIIANSSTAFRYTKEHVFEQVVNNLTSETIVNECLKAYQRYINCQYFKQKSVDK